MNDPSAKDLRDLAAAAKAAGLQLATVCDRLAIAVEVPRGEIDRAVEQALHAGRSLREALWRAATLVAAERPAWSDEESLSAAIETFSDRLQRLAKEGDRERLRALATELRGGAIVDPKAARREHLERLRATALGEVEKALEGDAPRLPWPAESVDSVVAWLAEQDGVVEMLSPVLPALASFVTILDGMWWRPATPKSSEAPAHENGSNASEPVEGVASQVEKEAPAPPPHRIDVESTRRTLRPPLEEAPVWAVVSHDGSTSRATKGAPRFVAPMALSTAFAGSAGHVHRAAVKSGSTSESTAFYVAPPNPSSRERIDVVGATGSGGASAWIAEEAPSEEAALAPVSVERESLPHTTDSSVDSPPSSAARAAVESEPVLSVPKPASQLPSELGSLKEFRTAFWRDERGRVLPAPWRQPDFTSKLAVAAEQALRDGQLAHLTVFSRAAEAIGSRTCPSPDDVRVLVGLLGGPRIAPRESDLRRTRLGVLMGDDDLRTSLAARLAVFIEAVTQSPFAPLPPAQGREFAAAAGFSAPIVLVLEGLFTLGSVEDEPLSRLRAALQHIPNRSAEDLALAITNAEADLRKTIKTLWSAAGGKIERTHCREAWQLFMSKAQVVFSELLEKRSWDDVKRLDGLLAECTRIADKLGVKFSDRHRMDRAAGELVSKARAVVTARREAERRSRAIQGHGLPELVDAFHSLPDGDIAAPHDACFIALLRRLLTQRSDGVDESVGSLPLSEFYKRPALLETLPTLSLNDGQLVDASTIADALSAAGHFILDCEQAGENSQSLSRHLRDKGREDLLAHVVPRSDTDAKFAADALGKAQAIAARVLVDARSTAVALDGIAHPAAQAVRAAVDEAEELLSDGQVQEAKPEILTAWVSAVREFGRTVLEESIPALREEFGRRNPGPDDTLRFEQALAQQQYAEVLSLARGEGDAAMVEDRATLWRRAAAAEFAAPRRTLKELRTRHDELCRLWLSGIRGFSADQPLRAAFVSFVFDTIARGKSNIKEPKARPETQVSMEPVRTALGTLGLNPSFVPQVTVFRDIAILTPTVATNDNTFVRSTTELLAKGTDGKITVLLAPGISSSMRDQLREALRKQSSKAVGIVDDLDLVRLLNPGRQEVNPILALLEIVLEQQPKWSHVNPFESHEGQHTKREMFVGRKEEAEALSQRPLYSRVFSGRRLGKSALLKHVHDSQEKAKLPSGNRLRVVYVPIVGLDSEDAVVRSIIKAFGGVVPEPPPGAPGERLKALVESYLRKETRGSVLVFLDEADTFVEAQIKQYEVDRERSLTWRMRSELEHERDSRDLPRVRFVFAGYRATHRLEGAWANWGDVLRLRPLSRNDAARLIAGPLARLGINATAEASAIAYRCGYQPAILVRFGQQLIEHLDNTITPARRDAVVITPEQVATVYQSPAVQQEIRTIVWNNFQGNPFGQIVFSALLLEFARMPPGAALDDAPSRVLQRLRSLVPSFMADETLDGPAVDRIARTLRDFVDRSLIDEVHPTTRSYRLRFPHQLNVLLQEDQEALIRRAAAALGGERLDAIESVRSLVPGGALEDLAYALANEGFAAGVVAAHWLDSVERRAASVATRLGYFGDEIVDVFSDSDEGDEPAPTRLALIRATPEAAERTLRKWRRESEHPLFIGGMDLLRWALRRGREGRDVELATVPRLSAVRLRWWFERVCEINWSGTNPVLLFMQKTGGIPCLVAQLDRELGRVVGLDGASASDAHVTRAVESFERGMDKLARELVAGDPMVALDRREQELLVMVSLASGLASVAAPTSKQRSDLLDVLVSPREYAEYVPGLAAFKGLTPDDGLALDVLLRCGLLISQTKATSTDPFERLHVLPPGDPAHRLAAAVERCLST